MIGIMADSHGQAAPIREALAVFDDTGCRSIYHLGDVCDSNHPETASDCMRLLQNRRVQTIKGNNDQAIVANHIDRDKSPVPSEVLWALKRLELVKYDRKAMFIHSLPFIRELGLSSMIGAMGPMEIRRFCNDFPEKILFRGHSHNPEIAWLQRQQVKAQSLAAGLRLNLSEKIPCVVTCGALTRGLCMIWNPEEEWIESISFR
ncbi:MAG: metallophosphoesterase family protein [Desulfobacterales bacterium]|jgi:predicted phosphodiesterase